MPKEIRRMGRAELETEVHQHRAPFRGYKVEPLALGWFCVNLACGVFNGDERVFLTECRACGAPRPHAP